MFGHRIPDSAIKDWMVLRSNGVCFQALEFGVCTHRVSPAAAAAAAGTEVEAPRSAYDRTSVPALADRCNHKHHLTPMTLQHFFNVLVKCSPHELPSLLRQTGKSKLARLMTFFFAHVDNFVSGNETMFALQMVADIVNFIKGIIGFLRHPLSSPISGSVQ